jgi:hypothetical protein
MIEARKYRSLVEEWSFFEAVVMVCGDDQHLHSVMLICASPGQGWG